MREILAYRLEFLAGFFGPIAINTVVLTMLWSSILKYQGVDHINGMSLSGFVMYYYLVSVGQRVLIGAGIGYISRDIYYGEINKYLIYPLNFQVFKWGTYFAPTVTYLLQLLLFIVLHKVFWGNSIEFVDLSQGAILLLLGAYCYFLIMNSIEYLAFWFENIWSLGVSLRAFLEFAGGFFIPLSFFPDAVQRFLNFTPFPAMLYRPVQIILGNESYSFLSCALLLLFWILIFFCLDRFVWKLGRENYTGVGI